MKMDFSLMKFYVLLIASSYHLQNGDGRTINIMETKHKNESGAADYSQVFKDAWDELCHSKSDGVPTLYVPENAAVTLHSVNLSGPCVPNHMSLQIDGRIEALGKPDEWIKGQMECLLCFGNVTGLLVNGSGLIHGHGEAWWDSVSHSHRPRTVRFDGVINMVYNGLTQKNSPKNHISVHNCTNATLSNLHLIAPEDSPNTDGIDVSLSNGLQIINSSIETGDDCIAINGGSRNINITRVACGPGHGISIGSLGRDGANETVENVKVRNCSFNGTQNGARIKTWAGGLGFARDILFENITLIDVDKPIVIDQHYCNGGHDCDYDKKTAVAVRNVTFRYFEGTCTGETAIKLDCDKKTRCRKIVMDHINITSSPSSDRNLTSYCRFADVISRFVSVDLRCPGSDDCPPPAPY